MKPHRPIEIAGVLAAAAIAGACHHLTMHTPASLDDPQPAFIASIRTTLVQERFDDLEKTAELLRRERARFPGGDWKLYRFYEAVSKHAEGTRATDADWEARIRVLERWRKAHPQSITAAVALGDTWLGYAWHARGTGFASTVTAEGWRLFGERLANAEQVLEAAAHLPAKCPHLYCARVDLARGKGWERDRVKAVFEDAVRLEPLYLHVYSAMARYLTPRWSGEPGDWERFAEASAERLGGHEGSVIYGHIAWQISKLHRGPEFFEQNRVSWERVKQGFIDREALYGPSRRTVNAFCLLAGAARDRQLTRELLARIGESWDPEIWKEQRYFDEYRRWASE